MWTRGSASLLPINIKLNLNSEIEGSSSCSSSSFVLRPREARWLTIRLTGQNNCRTIGLSSLQRTPIEDEDDDEHEDEDPNFGVWAKNRSPKL